MCLTRVEDEKKGRKTHPQCRQCTTLLFPQPLEEKRSDAKVRVSPKTHAEWNKYHEILHARNECRDFPGNYRFHAEAGGNPINTYRPRGQLSWSKLALFSRECNPEQRVALSSEEVDTKINRLVDTFVR